MTLTDSPRLIHLRRGGTSLIARLNDDDLPTVLHWGPQIDGDDLGDVLTALAVPVGDSVVYAQPLVGLLPLHTRGWLGHPGILGSRGGRSWSFAPASVQHTVEDDEGTARLVSLATDPANALEVVTELVLEPAGLVRVRATVTNRGDDGYEVVALEPALPVPAVADELLDMTGRHAHERAPQRHPFRHGRWTREAWGGRPGHDSATVLCAGESDFGFRRGTVWGVHLAWSGNGVVSAERTNTGWRLLSGGEKLLPGEIVLAQNESYSSPWVMGSWGDGLDAFAGRFHEFLRARPQHPSTARPVILNTWEAVYFDHDLPRLLDLAERAAGLGVERFVLDDGWFTGRRDDTAGLGDWQVDADVWPDGLGPLADRVHELGMEFGLWFEPEMVNLESELARRHPEWVFGTANGPGVPSRQQHVLDLGHPAAYEYVLESMSALIAEYDIDYLKWDHNRPLVDAGHSPSFQPGVHDQTLATYRMLDALTSRHPGLEIESCCGGGGRIDLGIMEHCARVWVSDCIDAHERQRLQRWTSLILPPELMGTHVGADHDHTTGRALDLDFRAGTAIWGHFGIEWDLAVAAPDDLAHLGEWIAFHKRMRPLLHSGTVVHADSSNPAVELEGVVARDGSEALYRLSVVDHSVEAPLGRIQLPGLDGARRYRVELVDLAVSSIRPDGMPDWARTGVTLSGEALTKLGLATPMMNVDRSTLIRAVGI
ncbi:alpha-galactosidase [Microbacterium memoriense]|uniref:Alpha-galactosidase n=1 Tax=Microbacterium memoriense TaxID=2978350 RepID=A0ABT2PET1_9MICO|nr:alpha-galactosidase [Microbacterium memoriense]MCT9002393.1 alpha-galactosidase [Microbacterium memoriense]